MSMLTNKRYHLAPCPYYDVLAMEQWLEEEARQGYLLSEDGFLFGVAAFEESEPCIVRYRLEPKEVMDWSAESLFPDQEARELCEEYGWKYIADRGKFFIYRSESADTRELNTDPEVQAMAWKPMWEHERYCLYSSLFWIVGYPLIRYLFGKESFLRMCIEMGTWLFAMGLFIGVWMLIRSGMRLAYVSRMRRRLMEGDALQSKKIQGLPLSVRRRRYWIGNVSFCMLILLWCCFVFQGCARDLENAYHIPLEQYITEFQDEYMMVHGSLPERIFPFADMTELVEKGLDSDSLEFKESGMYPGRMNYVETKRDLLASTVIHFNQNGTIMIPDGRTFDGILDVSYYDTAMPWIAKVLYWEYVKEGQRSNHYKEIPLPELPVDDAICFTSYLPTLVLRKGDIIMVVELVQSVRDESDYGLQPSQWAGIFAESMR